MGGISLRTPRAATAVLLVAVFIAFAAFVWRYVEQAIWPSAHMADRAYSASEECVRQISKQKDSILFAGFGLDPGAVSHLRKDGNYESSGWVEEMDEYGHRHHRTWSCVLRFDKSNNGDDHWSVVYLKIGKYTQGVYVPEN